ncbi:MAG: NAD-dependent epimerase/dehydratase family protein, partial [Bacteriovorax sp.]|nr:NAD-dependent epimerase/dehydratase family protein [Bacteriovorax sp.]
MSRIVVFGGSGFIGSRICLLLASQGHEVLCLGRSSVDFHDSKTWKNLIHEGDYVIDLVSLYLSKNSQQITEEVHLFALDELARECLSKKIKNFLYLSSGGSVYGRGEKAFSESYEAKPVSPYGLLKLQSERLLITYQERFDLPLSIARPSNIYGETQSKTSSAGVITNFYNRIASNIALDIYGDLEIRKDYLHVDDLVWGLSSLCMKNKMGIYNFGFGETHTLLE